MNLKNKFSLGICLLFLIGIISGCGVGYEKKNMYDDNEKIVQEGDSYTYINRIGTGNSDDKIDVKYSGFYGIDTIWSLELKEDGEITFNYDSTVNSGDFKAVLINPQKEIENIFEGTDQGEKTIKLTKGKYRFKIVGRKAEGKVKISINKNQNVEITNSNNH